MFVIYCLFFILSASLVDCDECTFGPSCVFPCRCSPDSVCNNETGECNGGGGCEEGWSEEGCQIGNVALGKPTFGTTTQRAPTSNAVDGNINTHVHLIADRARWTVDLLMLHVVQLVNITNFGNNEQQRRLQYTHVWLHNTSDFMVYTNCSYITQPTEALHTEQISAQCEQPTAARYVTLIKDDGQHEDVSGGYDMDQNSFSEVEVIGYQFQFNVAVNKPANQTDWDGGWSRTNPASFAVDGDYSRQESKGQRCAHPQQFSSQGKGNGIAWLRIDLLNSYTISKVILVNPDNEINHLRDTQVFISDDPELYEESVKCGKTFSNLSHTVDKVIDIDCPTELTGRYVTLRKTNDAERYFAILICEVIIPLEITHVSTKCEGYHGPGCLLPCNCEDTCNAITGYCPGDCDSGWMGVNCQQECPQGSWGVNCDESCLPGCSPADSCDRFYGTCENCTQYYVGESCQLDFTSWYTEPIAVLPSTDTVEISVSLQYSNSLSAIFQIYLNNTHNLTIHHSDSSQSLTFTLENLKHSSRYTAHVIPVFTYNSMQHDGPQSRDITLTTTEPQNLDGNGDMDTAVIAGVVGAAVVIVAVGMLLLLFFKRRKQDSKRKQKNTNESGYTIPSPVSKEEKYENLALTPDVETAGGGEDGETDTYANVGCAAHSRAIRVEELQLYVQQRKGQSEAYHDQYKELKSGMLHPAKCGEKPANKNKDRFKNMQAYDHSRVVLKGQPQGGYINANYISGYKSASKEYIAAIGPKKATTNDFWLMVWQENITTIVMLTRLVEGGRNKCHQYWPSEGSQQYGDVTVETVSSDDYADYSVTTMSITKQGEKARLVRHFFFISWPDHGVPNYATAFLAFYYKTMKSKATREKAKGRNAPPKGPLLVHCSAGVGRTGTFIALDILIQQAKHEGVVDVFGCVLDMRQERVNMVQTVDQYAFVHEALLESLSTENTMVDDNDFITKHRAWSQQDPLQQSELHKQYESLEMFRKLVLPDRMATDEINSAKNRNDEIIPAMHMRPFLTTPVNETNDYINAVYINSFRKSDFFILTQHPLPNTTADFWRLVHDHACASVISLTPPGDIDEDYIAYWPEDTETPSTFGPLEVTLQSDKPPSAFPDVTIKEIHVTKSNETPHRVKIYQTSGWGSDSEVPHNAGVLSPMLSLVERWQQTTGDGPIVIQCQDGARRCGVVCGLMYVLEQLRVDHEVDIYTAVKHMLPRRPQLVQPFAQFQYLYKAILQHLENYSEYSNFK